MPQPRIGSLFAGYGGLTEAVRQVFGGTVAWHSEIDPAPSKVLAHHWPDIPNLGDITKIPWADVEPVDIIDGGSPCQDVSSAGRRAGMRSGTRSGLWTSMCDAIETIRPRLVVWENVRGVCSAAADSDMEPCPWCMGDPGDGEPAMRALGRVVSDLADIGYVGGWCGLRAADIGAPHGRFRIFVCAWPAADTEGFGWAGRSGPLDPPGAQGRYRNSDQAAWPAAHANGRRRGANVGDLPSGESDTPGGLAANASRDGRDEGRPESAGLIGGSDASECGDALDGDAQGCLVEDWPIGGVAAGQHVGAVLGAVHGDIPGHPSEGVQKLGRSPAVLAWGPHSAAIARWERVLGRPAPSPTEANTKGGQRLSPAFVEWMMGLPAGHVTQVPGLSRNDQLKMLGNGVVPQQGAEGIRRVLSQVASYRAYLDRVGAA